MSKPALRLPVLALTSAAAIAVGAGLGTAYRPSLAQQPAPIQAPAPADEGYADLVQRVLPAVVGVTTERGAEVASDDQPFRFGPGGPGGQGGPGGPGGDMEEFLRRFFGEQFRGMPGMPGQGAPQRPGPSTGVGSGFIIDPSGYIVTNNHVVEGAETITVQLYDESEVEATLIGRDPSTDLALLKIEPDGQLPFVRFGESDAARVGDKVVAVGSPFGLGSTVTAGIISARGREIGQGPYDDFLQIDAPINRGNSGGPTFNMKGDVIGVNTAIFSPSGGSVGIGFAIPSDMVQRVVQDLRDDGRVERGWLGVTIQTVTPELAEGLSLDEARGALVSNVAPDGPAATAGLRSGDVILSFAGRPIDEMRTLPRTVAESSPGKTEAVAVWRDGEEVTLTVDVGRQPSDDGTAVAAAERPDDPAPRLGLVLAPLDPDARRTFNLAPDLEGVLVRDVDPNGPAAGEGIEPGDVIRQVDREAVRRPDEVAERVRAAGSAGDRTILMLVSREGQDRFVAVRMGDGPG